MDDGVDIIAQQQPPHEIVVADIAFDELGLIRHRPAKAGGEIVEDEEVFAGIEQLEHHMASDEAGAAGDQDTHEPTSKCGVPTTPLLSASG